MEPTSETDIMEQQTFGMEMLLRDEEQDKRDDERFFREAEQRDERQREMWAILQELSMREKGEEDREELRKLLRRRKQEDHPDDPTGSARKKIKDEPAPPPPPRPPPPQPPGPLPLFVLVKKVAYDYGALFGYIYVSIPTVYCSHQNQVYSTINRSSMFRIVVLYALILTCFPTPRSNENPKK